MHLLGEYPFGFDDLLMGFDLTFVMSVSRSSDCGLPLSIIGVSVRQATALESLISNR